MSPEVKYNWGIAFLKFIAAFAVVVIHFGNNSGSIGRVLSMAVPIFMFLACYLSESKLKDTNYLSKRILRVLSPFWFWGCATWFVFGVLDGCVFEPHKLLTQLLVGIPICRPLYFIPLLVLSTLIIFGLDKLKPEQFGVIVTGLIFASFALQYTGVNYCICSKVGEEYAPVVGRFTELLPFALAGFMYSRFKNRFRSGIVLVAGGGGHPRFFNYFDSCDSNFAWIWVPRVSTFSFGFKFMHALY